jgi:hypothetical protein
MFMPVYRKFIFRYFAGKIIMRQQIKVVVLVKEINRTTLFTLDAFEVTETLSNS